jgi:hypothetical protein
MSQSQDPGADAADSESRSQFHAGSGHPLYMFISFGGTVHLQEFVQASNAAFIADI